MTGREIVERIIAKNVLDPTAKVGVVGTFGRSVKVQGDGRTLEVIATTDDIDLDSEVVVPAGCDPSYFQQNGKVFVDHCYRVEDVVGTLRSLTAFSRPSGQSGWKMVVYMIPGLEMSDAVLAIAQAGGMGVSIGFEATDYGRPTTDEAKMYGDGATAPESIVRKWRWLETSFTPFPCNVNCQTLQTMDTTVGDEQKMSILDSLLVKGKITRKAAERFGLKTKPMRVRLVPKRVRIIR